jgi:rhamnulokinase
MAAEVHGLALDLGAESGRAVLGAFDGARLRTRDLHRFPNVPVRTEDGEHWDVPGLFREIQHALGRGGVETGGDLASVGLDTWGLDFALLDRDGALLGDPHTYRDPRTRGVMAQAFARVSPARIFADTGVQFMEINTLYQLLALAARAPATLDAARTLLMIPDLFNYWLTGDRGCEYTIATTTQCLRVHTTTWAWGLLDALGLPARLFPAVTPPGSVLGPLRPEVATATGLPAVRVVAPACHDTASAVVAVPARGADFAYISSGTWSLVGVELAAPLVSEAAREANLSNEGGVCGTVRLLRNVMGLWLLQGCRRAWQTGGVSLSYDDLVRDAEREVGPGPLIDPDEPSFLRADDMPGAIHAYLARTGQAAPSGRGGLVRCVLDSLALRYRQVIEALERVTGRSVPVIHIVGGGARNRLLCQLTADATRRVVTAGPVEATAVGNLAMQLVALGKLGTLGEIREVVRRSFDIQAYEPHGGDAWDAAYARFLDTAASVRP